MAGKTLKMGLNEGDGIGLFDILGQYFQPHLAVSSLVMDSGRLTSLVGAAPLDLLGGA
jgi:hypothetical protein